MIEQLDYSDLPQLVALSASVGWDYTSGEIATILTTGQVFGHKGPDGRLLSCAAICTYGREQLGSIGMVIVHPDHQGQGFGKAVTEACLANAPTGMPIMLVATDEGAPLYERLGFRPVNTLHKVICDHYAEQGSVVSMEDAEVIELRNEHYSAVVRLDAQAVGAERSRLLSARLSVMKNGLVLREASGQIVGFGLAIQGSENLLIGPVVAPADELALAVIDRLARGHKGKIRLDIPSQRRKLLEQLAARGFRTVRLPPVMMVNRSSPPWGQTLYAIAAQVFG